MESDRTGAATVRAPTSDPHPENRPLRVAIVISNLEYGGAERQVVELANRLCKFNCETHVVSLSEYVPLASDLNADAATLHIVERLGKFDVQIIRRLARLFRKLDIDVVHGFLFDAEILSRIAARFAGTKLIVGSERNSQYNMPFKKQIAYKMTRNLIDVCVANSEAGARDNAHMTGLPASRYRVIRNGVDIHRFEPADSDAYKRKIGVSSDTFVVSIFGSFKPQKNHHMFVEAAGLFTKSGRNAKFMVVGDVLQNNRRNSGTTRDEIMAAVAANSIEDRCIFTGNRDDVEQLYLASDVVVLPSLHEGTPNVALEAMASGRPVVATRVSDNAKVVIHEQTGFLVELDDTEDLCAQLIQLHDDGEMLARMSSNARAHAVENFSLDVLAETMAACYTDALLAKAPDSLQTIDSAEKN